MPAITAATVKAALRDRIVKDHTDTKLTGLQLRVKAKGARWSMRVQLHGRQVRFDLGPAVEGDEDIDGLTLRTARERGTRVSEMARKGQNPETYLRALTAGVSVETQIKIDAARPKLSWTWEDARTRFLAEVERTNRGDTLRDYRGKLQSGEQKKAKPGEPPLPPHEFDRFKGRMVNTITRNEMAEAIADIHRRGKDSMAAGVTRVVKRFFAWLAEPTQQDSSGVADGIMVKLKPPAVTRTEDGENDEFDEDDIMGDAPPEIEIGRALVMARQGYFPERIGLGIQLLIGTVQRRRAVTGAKRSKFKTFREVNSEQLWSMPPYFRKSGRKRGNRPHLVPAVGFAAEAVARLDRLSDSDESAGWLFPAGWQSRSGRGHAASDLFNDYFDAMPGVNFTPHAVRYAFATYGERDLGFAKSEAKLILDHMEGTEPNDITGAVYSSNPALARKRAMMRAWTDWCEEWAARAIAKDEKLLDREHMMRTLYIARYGEAQLAKRIALHEKRGWPLWPAKALPERDILQMAAE